MHQEQGRQATPGAIRTPAQVAAAALGKSRTASRAELSSGLGSSTGKRHLNNCFKSLLVVLLASPISGAGQQGSASRLESLVATAQQAQAAHDYGAAENAYRQAVRIEPQMPELWANLGLMEQQAGNIPAAVKSFLYANHLNPSLYVPNLFLGIDDLRIHKAQDAIPFLTKAEKINKADPQAPLALGRAYFATGKFTVAAREFERATTLDPRLS